MEREFVMGPHRARQIGDVLEVEVHGTVTREQAVQLHDRMAQVLEQEGSCYVLTDLADATTVDADARRYIADWNRRHRASGVASYNTGLATRAIATLLVKAIHLLGGEGAALVFVREEAEARAWIEARRAELAS